MPVSEKVPLLSHMPCGIHANTLGIFSYPVQADPSSDVIPTNGEPMPFPIYARDPAKQTPPFSEL